MNLKARKLEFIEKLLKVQSEEVISRLEKILGKENIASDEIILEPLTQEELHKRIDQSETDFRNKRYKSSSDLLAKYK